MLPSLAWLVCKDKIIWCLAFSSTCHWVNQFADKNATKTHCTVDLLFVWFGISCMTTDNFCFYLQNRLILTSQAGGQLYNDTSHFSIPRLKSHFSYLLHAPSADVIKNQEIRLSIRVSSIHSTN